MTRITGMGLLLLGAAGFAFAGFTTTPEIDATSAAGAITLLSGGLLVLRGRRRSK